VFDVGVSPVQRRHVIYVSGYDPRGAQGYFDLFRREKGKLSAVTFWGMADDDTWLDSFPVARTDYPLPFDMGLQAKPAYWGIVDPTHLPGYGLVFAITSTPTTQDRRILTVCRLGRRDRPRLECAGRECRRGAARA